MNQLLWYYAGLEEMKCYHDGNDEPDFEEADKACTIWRRFAKYVRSKYLWLKRVASYSKKVGQKTVLRTRKFEIFFIRLEVIYISTPICRENSLSHHYVVTFVSGVIPDLTFHDQDDVIMKIVPCQRFFWKSHDQSLILRWR